MTSRQTLFRRAACVLLLFGIFSAALGIARAQGSPPFLTDDAGTAAEGSLEVCVGVGLDKTRAGDRNWEIPAVDLSFGLTGSLEIGYGVPLLRVDPADGDAHGGLGNSVAGVKWRFSEDPKGWSVSVGPQVEFDNPGSSSRRHGLVANNTVFVLPFQLQRAFGGWDVWLNAGHVFHARHSHENDGWLAGIAAGRKVTNRWYAGAELYGESSRKLERGCVLCTLGAQFRVSDSLVIYGGGGTGVTGSTRPDFTGTLGIQWIH